MNKKSAKLTSKFILETNIYLFHKNSNYDLKQISKK